MGNNNDKTVVADIDKDFLRRKTSITENDLGMYDNFLIQHPDGEIARKEFRFNFYLLHFLLSFEPLTPGQQYLIFNKSYFFELLSVSN